MDKSDNIYLNDHVYFYIFNIYIFIHLQGLRRAKEMEKEREMRSVRDLLAHYPNNYSGLKQAEARTWEGTGPNIFH